MRFSICRTSRSRGLVPQFRDAVRSRVGAGTVHGCGKTFPAPPPDGVRGSAAVAGTAHRTHARFHAYNFAMHDSVVATSRFLSLILRHRPDAIGLTLDDAGWAGIDDILRLAPPELRLTRERIDRAVAENNKQRFAISDDGTRIRARQGHSIEVDLALPAVAPPTRLYHGTATRFVASIRRDGLIKRDRRHVHLSADAGTATTVGARHGKPTVLVVRASEMAAAGHAFFLSENGVWLTDAVPVAFIDFDADADAG